MYSNYINHIISKLMRYLKSFFYAVAPIMTLTFAACEPDPVKETPKEPVAPVIENAALTGLDGETVVLAGNKVKFTASVSVENSSLAGYVIIVRKGSEYLAEVEGSLSGKEAHIEEEIDLGLSPAAVLDAFYPDVIVKVTNTDDMYAEKKLEQAEVCQITVPELMDALWLVDALGHSYQMSPVAGQRGDYRTTADLSELGESFTIASKITSDGAVDASGESWTFDTPDDEGHGLRWIGFNYFTGELSKLLDLTITLDASKMATDGAWKVYWSFELVRDCRVVFLNYPEGLKLQGDRFADVVDNTARYTGHTKTNFEVYWDPVYNWLVVKNQYVDLDEIWVTGLYATHPMSPYTDAYSFNWFAMPQQTDASNMVKTDDLNRRLLLYLKDNFELKLYTERKWATELSWTSVSPDTFVITEMAMDAEGNLTGNFGLAGPSFTEGLWMLRYNISTKEASLEKYDGQLPVVGAGTADPDPAPTPDPDPEPEPIPTASLYLVDNAGKVFPMELVSGTHFVTTEMASSLASPFFFAERISESNAIDWTSKVWGTVDGAVAEIAEGGAGIPVDPAFAVYDKTPEYVGFDTASAKVIYRQEVWKPENTGCRIENCTVAWVQCLPEGCEVVFKGFGDLKMSEVVDHALFADIDDEARTAVHLGASENYELHFRTDFNWLVFMEMISAQKMMIIGNASSAIGMATSFSYPLIDSTISQVPGQTVQMYRRPDGKWYGTMYAASGFGGSLYAGFAWGDMQTGITASGDYIKVNDGMWLGSGDSLVEGRYLVEYDATAKVIGMSPLE